MKNKKYIKTIFNHFEHGDKQTAKAMCDRLKNNFAIDDDEVRFSLAAKVYQPYKETCDKLIADGRADLIGSDLTLGETFALKITVHFRSIEPVMMYPGDPDDDIDDMYYHYSGHLHIIQRGNGKVVVDGGSICCGRFYDTKRVKKQIKKWLNQKFGAGSCTDYPVTQNNPVFI